MAEKPCVFCNISPDSIVTKNFFAVLIREYGQKVPGTLQLVPRDHSLDFIGALLFLFGALRIYWRNRSGFGDHNVSLNIGGRAGQTMRHPHIWVIPRDEQHAGFGLAHYVAIERECRDSFDCDLDTLINRNITSD